MDALPIMGVSNILLLMATLLLLQHAESQTPNFAAMLPLIQEKERLFMQEPCDDPTTRESYDFIIVGAGAAGCVLTNSLTEVENWDVLLLEAGREEVYIMSIPYLVGVFPRTDAGWHYKTTPSPTSCRSMPGGQCDYPSGRVMGGSTSLNYMFYIRGNRRDYDNWEAMGNPGWGYDTLLPYFKKHEDVQIPELKNSSYHGTGGNIKVSYNPFRSPLSDIVIQAGEQIGEKRVDYNGESQTGFSYTQTMTSDGIRWSASRAFLHPVKDRKNLHVKKQSLVYEILINPETKTAYGVRYTKGGKNYTAIARKEVIISAGAVNSPQLLILSGIGPKDHLQDLGIPVIQDLKVGYNLMDHIGTLNLVFVADQPVALGPTDVLSNASYLLNYLMNNDGPFTTPLGIETLSFLELKNTSDYSPGWPNVETLYLGGVITNEQYAKGYGISDEVYQAVYKGLESKYTIMMIPFQLRPSSRGRITLKDKNISSPPNIDPMLFSHEDDVKTLLVGIRKMIELSQTDAFQSIGAKLHDIPLPPCKQFEFSSDDYWTCVIQEQAIPIYHQSGTCKMGPSTDKDAVVDPELKVYGIKNLRVVDASIMPQVPSGHLTTSTYVVGEKAAELIKKQYFEEIGVMYPYD